MKRHVLIAALLLAQGKDSAIGRWTGTLAAGGTGVPVVFEFKEGGGKITGTYTRGATPVPIAELKISGSKVSFKTTPSVGSGEIEVSWSGQVKKDELTLTYQLPSRGSAARSRGGAVGSRGDVRIPIRGSRGVDVQTLKLRRAD